MNFQNIRRALATMLLIYCGAGCNKEAQPAQAESAQAEPAQRNAGDVLTGMRLKTLAKELALTDEQKSKVEPLLKEENKAIEKLNADAALSVTERFNRIAALKKETYGRMKPLLTPVQAEKLEQMLNKPERRRRRS